MSRFDPWRGNRPDRYAAIHRGPESYSRVRGWGGEDVYVGIDRRDGSVCVAVSYPPNALDWPLWYSATERDG